MIIWLASYPKSGNTYLRAFLSAYYFSESGHFDFSQIKNIDQFPHEKFLKQKVSNMKEASKQWMPIQRKIIQDKKIKFFKTHSFLGNYEGNIFTSPETTLGAVYIIRDPRNVLTSLQNHYELSKDEALKFMLSEKKYIHDYQTKNDFSDFQFISSWEKNYQSWINQKILPVKLIRYEDLNVNTLNVLKEIIEFIQNTIQEKKDFNFLKAQNAVKSTNFENMKNMEKKSGFLESVLSKNDTKKIPFFHLGPKNDWKSIFDKSYQNKLNSIFENNLKELNYLK